MVKSVTTHRAALHALCFPAGSAISLGRHWTRCILAIPTRWSVHRLDITCRRDRGVTRPLKRLDACSPRILPQYCTALPVSLLYSLALGIIVPARHVGKVFRRCSSPRLERVTPRSPPPSMSQVVRQVAFNKFHNVLANVRQELESVASTTISLGLGKTTADTHPLSPVAKIKFFHFGCSQISSAASEVSVHQHRARLKSSLFLN